MFELGKPAQLPFRERGKDVSRLEGLSDAVIGFAITLAVVSLEVPRTSDDLLVLVRGLGSFAITFATLFAVWFAQCKFFRRYALEDDTTIWLTGALLFVVVFYTYPLKFLMAATFDPFFGLPSQIVDAAGVAQPVMRKEHIGIVFSLYGMGYGLLSGMFWALYRHAYSKRESLGLDEAETLETRMTISQWQSLTLFSTIFFGFLPVPMFPRQSFGRRAYLISYAVVLLISVVKLSQHLTKLRRERNTYLAKRTEPTPGTAS